MGKEQEVCAALPIEESLDYDMVKAAVLRAYELVPEAYRQKFWVCLKQAKQTYVEFAREREKTLNRQPGTPLSCPSTPHKNIYITDFCKELVL